MKQNIQPLESAILELSIQLKQISDPHAKARWLLQAANGFTKQDWNSLHAQVINATSIYGNGAA